MKKLVWALIFVLMFSMAACDDAAADITWEKLVAANTLEAVMEKVDSFTASVDGGDMDPYYVAKVDGQLVYAFGQENLKGNVLYNDLGGDKEVTFLPHTDDALAVIEATYEEDLGSYTVKGDIQLQDGMYVAKLWQEVDSVTMDGYAYFDAETLLMSRLEVTQSYGDLSYSLTIRRTYNTGADFALDSYDAIAGSENAVSLTVHYPDGTTQVVTVDRDASLSAYCPEEAQLYSVCWDEACTGQVDDLGWVTGDSADVYLTDSDVAEAAPPVDRVVAQSAFETMFAANYETYFQTLEQMDPQGELVEAVTLAWYMDNNEMVLKQETMNSDYEVVFAACSRANAWYSWSAEGGYAVDFYDEFAYAEEKVAASRVVITADQLTAPMAYLEDYGQYAIPYEAAAADGAVDQYTFYIQPDSDTIERVEILHADSSVTLCTIGGNGPIPGEKDAVAEITQPEGVDTLELTLVTASGEQTYTIRKDATVTWKGQPLYADAACTQPLAALQTLSGSVQAYVK